MTMRDKDINAFYRLQMHITHRLNKPKMKIESINHFQIKSDSLENDSRVTCPIVCVCASMRKKNKKRATDNEIIASTGEVKCFMLYICTL